MQNLPILLDQDGVLADFVKGLYRSLELFTSAEVYARLPDPASLKRFYIEDSVNTGDPSLDERLKKLIREVVDDHSSLFLGLPAIQGAVHYAQQLKAEAAKEGIDVIICTAPHVQNRSCHSDKANWVRIKLNEAWAKNMIMTHDKTLVQGLVLVDDKPKIKGALTPTWQHIIFDTSYNRDAHGPRVCGWNEQTVATIMEHAVKMQVINGLRRDA